MNFSQPQNTLLQFVDNFLGSSFVSNFDRTVRKSKRLELFNKKKYLIFKYTVHNRYMYDLEGLLTKVTSIKLPVN